MTRTMSACRLRSSMKFCGKRIRLRLQFHDRRPAATLILRRGGVAGNVRVLGKQSSDSFPQGARSVAVDYADLALAIQESSVEKLVDKIRGFVGGLADEIEFG